MFKAMALRHLRTCAFFLPLLGAPGLCADKPDFTGKWELVVEKSDFGGLSKPSRMTVESSFNGEAMKSIQTTYTAQESETTEFTWYLDGKRHKTDKPAPGFAVTRWEDNTLVTERSSDDGAYREVIHMSLSRDGKTATELIQTKNPSGTNKEKLVWAKSGK